MTLVFSENEITELETFADGAVAPESANRDRGRPKPCQVPSQPAQHATDNVIEVNNSLPDAGSGSRGRGRGGRKGTRITRSAK